MKNLKNCGFAKSLLTLAISLVILFTAAFLTFFYAEGWRFNIKEGVVKKTGMLAVRSIPEGAKAYLNGKLMTATNDTIQSLTPGIYTLKVKKEGFETWTKKVEIFPELVTDITAVLVLQSPRIEPLTNTGVSAFAISSSLDKIAYLTKNGNKPGIWVLPLSGAPLNLFKTNPNLIAADTKEYTYSSGEKLWWSPKDDEILVQMNERGFYLLDLQDIKNPKVLSSPDKVFERWQKITLKKKEAFLEKQKISEKLKKIALSKDTIWSPDEKKFMYFKDFGDTVEINVHNMENPLPVGEKRDYVTYRIKKSELRNITWYSDSYHLLLLENSTISLIRIDGTNKTEIFSGDKILSARQIYASPYGDKVIILASFKQNALPDLYAVGIR